MLLIALVWPITSAAAMEASWDDVQGPLSACAGAEPAPTVVALPGDIHAPGDTLTVGCDAVFDLDGHELDVRAVVVTEGNQLTLKDGSNDGDGRLTANATTATGIPGIGTTGATLIIESGTVITAGGSTAAGIGGGDRGSGGTVSISGGTVTATGGSGGAGIGGGGRGSGGTVSISGGTVTATGGNDAAGIGGGANGGGGTVSISGGTVTAAGGSRAAGVGGGYLGTGGTVDVGADAVVTATGGHAAIGAGSGRTSLVLAVAGTLRLPTGNLPIPSGTPVTVAAGGRILGGTADPTVGANFVGIGGVAGSIANQGVIALSASHVTGGGVTVSGNHYRVAFDPAGGSPTPEVVTVFGPSFETGHRAFPTDPTREDALVFGGWTDQPGGAGTPIDATSTLPGSSTGPAVQVTAYADWRQVASAATSTITVNPTSITANGSSTSTITVQVKDANGNDLTEGGDAVTLSTTAGTLSAVSDDEDGTYTATLTSPMTAGTATVSGTLNTVSITDTAAVTFTALAPPTTSAPTPTPTPAQPEPDAPDVPDVPEFDDVSAGSVHATSIDRIVRYGITEGISDSTFGPSGDLSRRQMSTFLARLMMLTDPSIERPVDHEAAMVLLVDKGLLLGDANGNLDGMATSTRGQTASLLARVIEEVTGDTLAAGDLDFSDVSPTHTHAGNIDKLVEVDVIHGYGDNTFRSGTKLRRDQMASLISRTIDVLIASGHIEDLDSPPQLPKPAFHR